MAVTAKRPLVVKRIEFLLKPCGATKQATSLADSPLPTHQPGLPFQINPEFIPTALVEYSRVPQTQSALRPLSSSGFGAPQKDQNG
jgi:hypothetical protein